MRYKMINKNQKNNILFLYFAAFSIPVAIICVCLLSNSITPFGNNTLVLNDLELQLIPFLTELSEKLKSHDSILFSFRRGLGFDFWCESAYYLNSPLNIFCVLFDKYSMPTFISLLFTVKSGLCGITMYYCLSRKSHSYWILLFSSSYALSSYITNSYIVIMWLDVMILLPLLVTALYELLNNGKKWSYCIFLAATIITNYYIAYMVCLFLAIYTLFYLVIINPENRLSKFITFIKYSLLGGLISSFVIIPEYLALQKTYNTFSLKEIFTFSIKNPLYQIVYRLFTNFKPRSYHNPNLYSGLLCLIFAIVFFFNKAIHVKMKYFYLSLLIITFLSTNITSIEYIANGFHIPNGYPGRNSFIFSFLLVYIAYESFTNIKFITIKRIIYPVLASLIIFAVSATKYNNSFVFSVMFTVVSLVLLYLLIIYINQTTRLYLVSYLALLVITTFELYISVCQSVEPALSLESYQKQIDLTTESVSEIDKNNNILNTLKPHANYSSLIGYNDISTLSSVSNHQLLTFLSSKGMFSAMNGVDAPSFEPFWHSFLGIRYIITDKKYTLDDILTPVNTASENKIYENNYYMNLGCILPITNDNNKTLFDEINDIANYFNIDKIYTPISSLNDYGNLFFYTKGFNICIFRDNSLFPVYETNASSGFIKQELYNNNYICYYPLNKGDKIEILDSVTKDKIKIYSINTDTFISLMNTLKQSDAIINKKTSTSINAKINIPTYGTYVTQIPYSSGWNLKIDGTIVKTKTYQNALLSFDIDKGVHTIELEYHTPGLSIGSFISFLSLITLILITVIENKKKAAKI